jgi:hypothetical protein
MAERTGVGVGVEVIPNPDPSVITTGAIEKAVISSAAVINARIDGMEKAVAVFQADLTRVPTSVDRAILALRELEEARFKSIDQNLQSLHNSIDPIDCDIRKEIGHLHALLISEVQKLTEVTAERFTAVGAQFSERDTRTDQRAGDTKLAVDAAFAAAKEATAKIEAGFTKQIDSMITIIDTKTGNLAGGLSDNKERITALESRTQGIGLANQENRSTHADSRALIFAVMATCIAGAGFLVAVMTYISVHGTH